MHRCQALILSTIVLIAAGSCYTIVDLPKTVSVGTISPRDARDPYPPFDTSIVEGIVSYYGDGNTPETHYHSGFVLDHFKWIKNAPFPSEQVLYLYGHVDSTYLRRVVRVRGILVVHRRPDDLSRNPDYTSAMTLIVHDLQVIR
jgi:hypothetical protein